MAGPPLALSTARRISGAMPLALSEVKLIIDRASPPCRRRPSWAGLDPDAAKRATALHIHHQHLLAAPLERPVAADQQLALGDAGIANGAARRKGQHDFGHPAAAGRGASD